MADLEPCPFPCAACGQRHLCGEFPVGSFVIHETRYAQVFDWGWRQGPLWIRIELGDGERKNVDPCEIKAAPTYAHRGRKLTDSPPAQLITVDEYARQSVRELACNLAASMVQGRGFPTTSPAESIELVATAAVALAERVIAKCVEREDAARTIVRT